jgi:small subunit ribosomal protein S16
VVKIRLARHGSKKNPIYRVVVADSREPRDGKTLETIGRYNPQMDPSLIEIDTDRANAWIANGAQPTEPVAKLLKIAGNATAAGA